MGRAMREAFNPVVQFKWVIPEGGFEWRVGTFVDGQVADSTKPEPILVWADLAKGASIYPPLEDHPELFRTFASLEPTPGSILEFANRFGSLSNLSSPLKEWPGTFGEPLRVWETAIKAVRQAVTLWDA